MQFGSNKPDLREAKKVDLAIAILLIGSVLYLLLLASIEFSMTCGEQKWLQAGYCALPSSTGLRTEKKAP
jgi:hypothetical protein